MRSTPERRRVEEWALVLLAEGVTARMRYTDAGYELCVSDASAARAESILDAYAAENPQPVARKGEAAPAAPAFNTGLGVAGALFAFFALVTGPFDLEVGWFARGAADAERILAGEWWRAATALTLHADAGHLLSNAIAGGFFVAFLAGAVGPGLGLAVCVLAGIGGNLLNAVFHGTAHISVGASTSVFGALGALGGLAVVRRQRRGVPGHRRFLPVAAGLGLVAMLGTSERADVGAHLFGLAVGGLLGLGVAFAERRRPGAVAQWGVGVGAVSLLLLGWSLAAP